MQARCVGGAGDVPPADAANWIATDCMTGYSDGNEHAARQF
ncbi:hypothetical protein SAMN04488044_2868 [Cognatishimia maritima]|uniref:Uncharacterized protein n=1 Tax=Cognatishimia maritima TaxID=870908 RepID=A0A1M5UCX3_9RHOB|nr:hypothetical protein SAMN04488044_2868 [Cognatishimia maritima]